MTGKARLASALRNVNAHKFNSNNTTGKATTAAVKFLDLELMSQKSGRSEKASNTDSVRILMAFDNV